MQPYVASDYSNVQHRSIIPKDPLGFLDLGHQELMGRIQVNREKGDRKKNVRKASEINEMLSHDP